MVFISFVLSRRPWSDSDIYHGINDKSILAAADMMITMPTSLGEQGAIYHLHPKPIGGKSRSEQIIKTSHYAARVFENELTPSGKRSRMSSCPPPACLRSDDI